STGSSHLIQSRRATRLLLRAFRLELESLLERRCARLSLAEIVHGLEAVRDLDASADTALLEGHGWTCVAGASMAVRHLHDESEQERALAILSNKADEIAGVVDCWALRERVLEIELDRRERLAVRARRGGAEPEPWLLDRD